MTINQGLGNLGNLGGIINEANRLLGNSNPTNAIQKTQSIENDIQNDNEDLLQKERITYGMISLELMSDEQYLAFERVTAGMSPNEKISVAQTLTRAGNLSASVERVEQREKNLQNSQESNPKATNQNQWFLGITQEGWGEIAQEFQNNLNHLDGIYTKSYNKNLSSNYNDIMQKNQDAKTQRILREFSHAIHLGNLQIDTMS
ncbi:hypothetical protein [Helicobacter canadensis]|uniref:Uncharacterized protein n=1 Tax=Helicobacter canadensis MIT 98-5491 TaxID=537970 RepID=C5ZYV6_9HELI|nr:hypothetical protein [Helicobacter canadensis]EES89214.1 hypothetical protein HCAN_0497 [Helicobacter canadensis MIT 98-5491]EFR47998.1 hypothetical protein HCMG_00171 [Helicobacter canadensis MIT 98-5491]STO99248.1 Uncharacterised protein [Helicobacter canadensis]